MSYIYFQRCCRECGRAYVSRHTRKGDPGTGKSRILSHRCEHMNIFSALGSMVAIEPGVMVIWNERMTRNS